MDFEAPYYTTFAAAYVRGVAMQKPLGLEATLLKKPLEGLTAEELEEIMAAGKAENLKLHYFKNTHEVLPRVKRVLSFLKSTDIATLLDVGSGRGVFLWPCLDAFPQLAVTGLDILPHRAALLRTVQLGGLSRLEARLCDVCDAPLEDKCFDAVTLLEVLEHMKNPLAAIRAAVRMAGRYVVVSVPSKPDTNPEHIHLLTKDILTGYFLEAGCTRLHFDAVPGHLILIAVLDA